MSVDEVAKSVREGAAKCGVEEVQGEVVEVWKEEEGELDGEEVELDGREGGGGGGEGMKMGMEVGESDVVEESGSEEWGEGEGVGERE